MRIKALAMAAVICMTAIFSGCHSSDERKSEDERKHEDERQDTITDEYEETIEADGCELVYKMTPEANDAGVICFENILYRRGITDCEIDITAENEITVFVPGIEDPEVISELLEEPRELSFVDSNGKLVLDEDDVVSAEAVYGDSTGTGENAWFIAIELSDSAREAFADATEEMATLAGTVNNYIQILIGEEVISAPFVDERIDASELVINGNFTEDEAKALATEISSAVTYEFVSAQKASRTITVKTVYGKMLDAISELTGKPVDKITQSDIEFVDSVAFFQIQKTAPDGSISVYPDAKVEYDKTVILNKGDKAVSFTADYNEFKECLEHLTGIRSLIIEKYSFAAPFGMEAEDSDTVEFDFSLIPADKYDGLEDIFIYGVPVKNLDMIASHKGLTNIVLCNAGITDISALAGLDNDMIQHINLSENMIADLSPIAHIDEEKILYEVYEEDDVPEDDVPIEGADTTDDE